MKYDIVTKHGVYDTREADSPEEALVDFATFMDLDMNCYFKAVPSGEIHDIVYEIRIGRAQRVRAANQHTVMHTRLFRYYSDAKYCFDSIVEEMKRFYSEKELECMTLTEKSIAINLDDCHERFCFAEIVEKVVE